MALPRSRKPFVRKGVGVRVPLSPPFSGIQACPPFGRPVNSRSYADVAQLVEHLLGKQEVTSSNLVVSSSTALRWGVARLAIGRNDAAVNKRTSERLWNALGLKQFCFGGGSTLGNKKPEMEVKSSPKRTCGISSAGTSICLTSRGSQVRTLYPAPLSIVGSICRHK